MEKPASAFSTAFGTFWSPIRSLREAADGRRWILPILLATALSGLFAALAVPRIDYETAVADRLDASPAAAKMTPHERKEAIATAKKVGAIGTVAGSLAGPPFMILFASLFLWLAFKVAGGAPGYVPTLSVVSHGLLPTALKTLLTLPALARQESVTIEGMERLLPSNLGALLAETEKLGPKLMLLSALDLFNLWALALIAVGMAHVAGVSRLRAAITSCVIWGAYVAIFHVALPSLGAAAAQ